MFRNLREVQRVTNSSSSGKINFSSLDWEKQHFLASNVHPYADLEESEEDQKRKNLLETLVGFNLKEEVTGRRRLTLDPMRQAAFLYRMGLLEKLFRR